MDKPLSPFVCAIYVVGGVLALGLLQAVFAFIGCVLVIAGVFGLILGMGWIAHNVPRFGRKPPPALPDDEDDSAARRALDNVIVRLEDYR
jgi:hypothetical protein